MGAVYGLSTCTLLAKGVSVNIESYTIIIETALPSLLTLAATFPSQGTSMEFDFLDRARHPAAA